MVFKGFGLVFEVETGDEIRCFDSIVMFSFSFYDVSSDSTFFTGLIALLFKGNAVFVFLGELREF